MQDEEKKEISEIEAIILHEFIKFRLKKIDFILLFCCRSYII